ncbi:aromatic ring-hydroxylating dioxygenase subunit alpha [Cyanobium sp. PCC 7001]|uniref:Rieske 2Fe-2S domain-containing protein n=1 Tax=Cyanobium sp. PCC 7001 TaxID=180281 RepID=UPI0009FBB725
MSTSSPSAPVTWPRDCWYGVGVSTAFKAQPHTIRFLGDQLVGYRDQQGEARLVQGRCAHRGCHLGGGWLEGGELVCPYHGWKYGADGVCNRIPALRPEESIPAGARISTYQLQEKYGLVWAWVPGESPVPTYAIEDIPELQGMHHHPKADIKYLFGGHFTRTIENGIDPVHAPFLHGKSVGQVSADADLTYPDFDVVNGDRIAKARFPVKVEKISGLVRFFLKGDADSIYKEFRFIYPNVTVPLNRFGSLAFASVMAHIPYSESETLVVATNWRNFLARTPLLCGWFDRETMKTGLKILTEDNGIVQDQFPRVVRYRGSNEVLIKSDGLVLEFRRVMRRFMEPPPH